MRQGRIRQCWEWLGHLHLAAWLFEIAAVTVSGLHAGGAAYWASVEWAKSDGYLTVYLVGLFVFVTTLWGINAALWMLRQRRPSHARITFDYAYALPLIGVEFGLDVQNKTNTLEIRPRFRNVGSGPIKGKISLRVEIEDRFVEFSGELMVSKDTERTYFMNKGFSEEAYRSFQERTHGKLKIDILYGHPSDALSRHTVKEIDLLLFKKTLPTETLALTWLERSDTDEPV